jgi:hypothetical protein
MIVSLSVILKINLDGGISIQEILALLLAVRVQIFSLSVQLD